MFTFFKNCILFTLVWVCFSFSGKIAEAHLMPTGHGTINITGDKAYIVISVPANSFHLSGTRGGGLLNQKELFENSESIRAQLKKGLILESQNGRASFEKILLNLPSDKGSSQRRTQDHDEQTNVDLTMMIVAKMTASPEWMSIQSTLWGNDNDSIKFKTTVSEGTKTIRSELGTLSVSHPKYIFFASSTKVIIQSMNDGFLHIIAGWDHFLFVILILLGPFIRFRWLALTLSFASAYTLGFASMSLGWVSFPVLSLLSASMVEWIILASLAIALLPVIFKARPNWKVEAAIVFVFGVVHGLGFASAMDGAQAFEHLVELKIFGFNVGVLLGQLLITLGVFLFCRADRFARRFLTDSAPV